MSRTIVAPLRQVGIPTRRRRMGRSLAPHALLLLLAQLTACGDNEPLEPTGPEPGTGFLVVDVSTEGAGLDSDGYTVTIDGTLSRSLNRNGTTTFTRLTPGAHSLALSGVAANCSEQSGSTRTVEVTAGTTTRAELTVLCVPTIQVSVHSSGLSSDPDDYQVTVDGALPRTLPSRKDGTVMFGELAAGDRQVLITDVADNCTVQESDSRVVTVAFGSTAEASFEVRCVVAIGQPIVFSENGAIVLVVPGAESASRIGPKGFDPALSPDGQRVAFTSEGDIWVVNVDGSNAVNLTKNAVAENAFPAWSPDGTRIAFSTGGDIWVMGADGSNPVNITGDPDGFNVEPAWAPDATRIVYSRLLPDDFFGFVNGTIRVVNADGTSPTDLTEVGPYLSPAWSPDGQRIAFSDGSVVMLIDADAPSGTSPLPIGEGADPAWSRDGTALAFVRNVRGAIPLVGSEFTNIWVMGADGSNPVPLTNDNQMRSRHPTWGP